MICATWSVVITYSRLRILSCDVCNVMSATLVCWPTFSFQDSLHSHAQHLSYPWWSFGEGTLCLYALWVREVTWQVPCIWRELGLRCQAAAAPHFAGVIHNYLGWVSQNQSSVFIKPQNMTRNTKKWRNSINFLKKIRCHQIFCSKYSGKLRDDNYCGFFGLITKPLKLNFTIALIYT